MFTENVEDVRRAEQAQEIPSGDYEADITGVNEQKPQGDKKGAWVVTYTIAAGDFEGCEYTDFVTWSPKAAGIRAKFYKAIVYVVPEDGIIDHNDFIGSPALVTIENKNGQQRVRNVQRSARANDGDGSQAPADNDGF